MEKIAGGRFGGQSVRVARNVYRCDFWNGAAGRCSVRIRPGDRYVEGGMSPEARRRAPERLCLAHVEAEFRPQPDAPPVPA